MWKRIILWILGLAALFGGGGYWYLHRSAEVPAMITARVQRMDLEQSVLASGVVHAFNTIDVGAQVSGQLLHLHADLGDAVTKGQLLAEIDPQQQENALKKARAALTNVQAQKKAKQAQLRQYRLELARQQRMRGHDASAQADLESARANADVAAADIAALDAQIEQARVDVASAEVDLGYTRITAPIDGVVVDVTTKEGQTIVSAQTVSTILTLAVLDTVTVKAEISEADVGGVKPGQEVYFTTLGSSAPRHSTLRAIEPSPTTEISDSTSASSADAIYYNGLFDVPNKDHSLRIGMTAQATIVQARSEKTLAVPVSAVTMVGPDKATVAVLKNGKSEKLQVRTGLSDKVHIEVLDGLHEGDQIVVGDAAAGDLPVETATRRGGPGGPPPGGS